MLLVLGLSHGFVAGYQVYEQRQMQIEEQRQKKPDTMYAVHIFRFVGDGKYVAKVGSDPKEYTLKFYPLVPEFDDDSLLEWIRLRWTPNGINIADPDLGYKVHRENGVPVKYSALNH